MKYKSYSLVNEPLSVIGLGTWQFAGSNDWSEFDKDNAIKLVHEAIDSGINFIDTAPVYGLGNSEKVVGEAIKGKRDKVFLATKCGLPWNDENQVRNDLTAKNLYKEIDDSLSRLNTDYIDLYQIHWPDPNTDIVETMEALNRIKSDGKIRYIGVSNFSEDLLKKAMEVSEVVSHQGLYNMIEQNAPSYHNIPLGYSVKDSLLSLLEKNGQFFLPYSPLMQGLLAGRREFSNGAVSNNPELQGDKLKAHIAKIDNLASKTDKPLHEVALNWLISQKTVGPVIAGCTTPEELRSNLKALTWTMDVELMNLIESIF